MNNIYNEEMFQHKMKEQKKLMKNVYDILHEKELMYILSEECTSNNDSSNISAMSIAIAVNLYYEETLGRYLGYIDRIPSYIDVYVISSNAQIWDVMADYVTKHSNVHLIKKENRGRDISALLVEFRKIALQYQYICYVHDKKANYDYLIEDVEFWIQNLWDNTLKSAGYIKNVIDLMERNEFIGLLVPPNPIGEHMDSWYTNTWYGNFDNIKKLALELKLNCNLEQEKMPIALGTAFWCRTKALRKLLEREWKYENFQEEPLPKDGTLSHAIERVLPYVAQDAGYNTGVISCVEYSEKMLLKIQKMMTESFKVLERRFGIGNVHQLLNYEKQETVVHNFFTKYEKVYLYGAGAYGKKYLDMLKGLQLEPRGFLATVGHKNSDSYNGYPVFSLDEICVDDNMGIIVTTNYPLQEELENNLKQMGIENYMLGSL